MTPWQNCLVKCHIDKMASPFLMSPWHREKPCTWAGIIYHHLPHRHIINTLTNVTRTNVTQTNCHLDKILPFRCHDQVSSVTSIFSSEQMSPGQMSLGQMSPGQILPCQPCSTAQLDHQKHLFPLVPSLGPSVENPDAAEAGKCGWCLRKQEGAVGWPEPGNNPL